MRDTKDIADAVFRIRDEHLEQMKKAGSRYLCTFPLGQPFGLKCRKAL